MNGQELKSNGMLLLTAAIWGFAFVAQSIGSLYLGSFTFNGVRFALGSLSLIPLIIYFQSKREKTEKTNLVNPIPVGIIAGSILFFAASLQQIGLVETSAGKAAFITGLYIVIVPILGIFLKHSVNKGTWIGTILAVVGLYFVSVNESFTISRGDLYEIIGAFLWAVHILFIDNYSKKVDALKLSFIQFATCSILSLLVAIVFEKISLGALRQAAIPLFYGGVCSVGIAYTLQVVGQKHAKPSHAAIIFSLEAVFASIGGVLILNENLGFRGYLGCSLMLLGMILSQVQSLFKSNKEKVVFEESKESII
ncbi:MAG: DMT family transporter [Clostridiaceae bacterium]